MNDLIIFHPEKKTYIRSNSYEHYSFSHKEAFVKLDELTGENPNNFFVFRINFENQLPDTDQKIIYSLPFIDIFRLLHFEEIDAFPKCNKQFDLYRLEALVDRDKSTNDIKLIRDKIAHGYFYQVNYTIPFAGKTLPLINPTELFLSLRPAFKGDFHALIPLGHDLHLLSFSPELFLSKNHTQIISEPIKGTAPNEQEEMLLNSSKEAAELSMIVDLIRNDMNSVCHSPVKVNFHRKLMPLTHLTHTFSQIEGQTNQELGKIFHRMLPGGSISGCPKKESLHTIYELEKYRREHYSGIIGSVLGKKMRSAIVIRSMLYNRSSGSFTYNAGSGIVYDSIAEEEIKEIYLKSKSLMENPAWNLASTNVEVIALSQNYEKNYGQQLPNRSLFKEKELLFSTLLLNLDGLKDLDLHLERLYSSLKYLKWPLLVEQDILKEKILFIISSLKNTEKKRFRINISKDCLFVEWETFKPKNHELVLGILPTPFVESLDQTWQHKLNQYDSRYLEVKKYHGLDDLIFCNEKENVTETSIGNIFFIDRTHHILWTPPITDGLLPGIERQKLLNNKILHLDGKDFLIEEKSLSMIEVKENFTEALITNSLIGICHAKIKI